MGKLLHTPPTNSEKERKKVKPNAAVMTLEGGVQRATAGAESDNEAEMTFPEGTAVFKMDTGSTPQKGDQQQVAFGLGERSPPQLVMQSPAPQVVLVEDEEDETKEERSPTIAYEDEDEGFREGRPADEEW